MKSKIGKSLYFIFGATDEVRSFDEHHMIFKDHRYESSKNVCQNLQLNMGKRIPPVYENAKTFIKSWEKDFFKNNFHEPTSTDMDYDTLKIYKRMTHAKSVIKAWKL